VQVEYAHMWQEVKAAWGSAPLLHPNGGISLSKYQYTNARSRQRASSNHITEESECSVIS
jgi:hypothetical protein